MASFPSADGGPVLDREKHIKYWLRCFKTFLPTAYTSTDSNRMLLGFMILCSLDLLSALHPSTLSASDARISSQERQDAVNWLYRCQHPDGGFRSYPGTDFGADRRTTENAHLDPANAAGTFFALVSLVVLRDDLSRVDRGKCMGWVRRLQAEDGSFAEVLGSGGKPEGKRDVRHSYFAVAIRHILGTGHGGGDIDRERLVDSVLAAQSYDGGVGAEPGAESHGGFAYCAVGALRILGKLGGPETWPSLPGPMASFVQRHLHWLVHRQVAYNEEDESEDNEGEDAGYSHVSDHVAPDDTLPILSMPLDAGCQADLRYLGFNGRCNKPADTCYSFWVGGTLALLGVGHLIDSGPHSRFLLERTESRFGGFGKFPGELPDILHSCTGLAALSLTGEKNLKPLDPTFCIPSEARAHMEKLRDAWDR